jgi:hypothetical protein
MRAMCAGSACSRLGSRGRIGRRFCLLMVMLDGDLGVDIKKNLPFVMPRSVRTTRTILHSSLWPGNSAGVLSSSSESSSLESESSKELSAFSFSSFEARSAGWEMGLPPKKPRDFA